MHTESQPLGRFEVEELESVNRVVAAADYGVGGESFVVRVERKFDADHFPGKKVSLGADADADFAQIVTVTAKREVAVAAGNTDDAWLRVFVTQRSPAAGDFADCTAIHDFAIDEDAV